MSKLNKQQVPKIRFEGFSDKWSDKVIGDIADIKRGASPRPISDPKWFNDNSAIGWVRISDVTRSFRVLEKTEQYLSDEGVKKSRLIKSGSIIMSICATIGKPVYTAFDVCIHDGFVVFDDLKIDADYTLYFLQTIQDKWYQYGQPGTQVNLNSDIVSNENIKYPSLEEQTQIGNFFQQLDQLIELQTRAVESAESYKKAMLQKMFPQKGEKVPRVRFAGFSGDWRDVALGDLVDKSIKWSFVGGPFGSNLKAEDYTVEGVRVIQLQNIGDGEFIDDHHLYVSPEKADDLLSCNIYPNDILIAKMGDPVARCCIVPEFHDRYLMCSDGIRVVVDSSKYHSLFIYQSINLSSFREKAISVGTGSTRKRINLSDLKKLELSAPCLEEQAQIGNFFQKLDQQIEQQAQKLATYQQLKKAMLQRMFV